MYVSLKYAPLIPLYGYLFDPFNQGFYPRGVSLMMGFIPIRRSWGSLGLELAPSWNMPKADAIDINFGILHLNGVYQWSFHEQLMVLIFRSGAGINLIYGTNRDNQDTGSIFTWVSSVSGEIAFRWFIRRVQNFRWTSYRTFYLEIGAEYIHLFSKDSPAGYGKPNFGAGWRF
jgi:hypothetical protein